MIPNNTYKMIMNKQENYLDKIDLEPYICKYPDLTDVWIAVSNDYDYTELTNNEFLNGCTFNYMDLNDLRLYIKNTYKIDYDEVVTYRRRA